MRSIEVRLGGIRRPATLVQAARLAAGMRPDRKRLSRRVLPAFDRREEGADLNALEEREAQLESMRTARDPGYAVQSHVEALTALLIELRCAPDIPQANASGSDAFRCSTKDRIESAMPSSSGGAS